MTTVGPKDYFAAGHDLLAEGGVTALTISNLCARLHVTKGSFYYHFRSGEDFQERLLDDWLVEHVDRRPAVTDAIGDPLERLRMLMYFAVERRHETESAIRAWGRTSSRAAAVQQRIDDNRVTYLLDTCVALGVPLDRARTFAQLAVVVLAGAQNLAAPVDREMVARIFDEVSGLITAAIPASPAAPADRRRELTG